LPDVFVRFLIGGLVVSAFATIGTIFKPTSFAGLFGAAPSVALATLSLAILNDGKLYASTECRSMMAGAVGLCLYSVLVTQFLVRFSVHCHDRGATAVVFDRVCFVGHVLTLAPI